MSLYHVVGSQLVAQDDAREQRLASGRESVRLPVPATEPIGTGKPLSIILRHIYTGRFPTGSRHSRDRSLLRGERKMLALLPAGGASHGAGVRFRPVRTAGASRCRRRTSPPA